MKEMLLLTALCLAGCTGDRTPYDPEHSAADRYGGRSEIVNGLFYDDLCAALGWSWSNQANGACVPLSSGEPG